MKITDYLDYISYEEFHLASTNIDVKGIAYNSKLCKQDFIFVAIPGEKFDGHNFISNAIENGAKIIVCEKLPEVDENLCNEKFPGISFLLVKNSRIALAELSHAFYGFPTNKLKIIGITGTNGKTTTTFLLKSILEEAGKKVGVIGTVGIFIGDEKTEFNRTTPESLELAQIFSKMQEAGVEYVIMEVSSHSLVLHRTDTIDFKVAAFTNLTHEHLDFHKTIENYVLAKKKLFDSLQENSIAIVNSDDVFAEQMLQTCKATKIKFGREEESAEHFVKIFDEKISKTGSQFKLNFDGKNEVDFKINLTARYNVENATIAIIAAKKLDIDDNIIKAGLLKSNGAPGRLEIVQLKNGAVAYVDYAHTPDALEKALVTCKNILENESEKAGKLICVFGCGGDRDKSKRAIMGKISTEIADITILTDDNPRTENNESIIDDIMLGVKKGKETIRISDRESAIKKAVELASNKEDIIIVAGKGHENYQIIGTETKYFSDMDVLKLFA